MKDIEVVVEGALIVLLEELWCLEWKIEMELSAIGEFDSVREMELTVKFRADLSPACR